MASLNKVLLIGNLTRDTEVRMLPSGNPVCNFGLAVGRNFKDAQGNLREETAFVDVEAFGKIGETIGRLFSKGRPIFIEGRLKLDQWESKTGEKRSKLRVVLDNFEFVDSKQDAERGYGSSSQQSGSTPPSHQDSSSQQPNQGEAVSSESAPPSGDPDLNANAVPDSSSPPADDPDLNEDVPF